MEAPPLRDPNELYPREAGLEEHGGTSHHKLDHFQIVFLFQGFNLLLKLCNGPIYLSSTKLFSVA